MKDTKQSGFLEIIVLIIVALLIMKYFGITVSEVISWLRWLLNSILSFFGSVLR